MYKNSNSKKVLMITFIIMLLLLPTAIYAHGEQGVIIGFSSLLYLLLGGLLLGLFELKLINLFSESNVSKRRLILFNYFILILSYIIFSILVYFGSKIYMVSIDSISSVEDFEYSEKISTIKLIISLLFYFISLIGLKYLIYSKKVFKSDSKHKLILIIIPNVIVLGLFVGLIFNNLVWIF
jgi:hypothetical protein